MSIEFDRTNHVACGSDASIDNLALRSIAFWMVVDTIDGTESVIVGKDAASWRMSIFNDNLRFLITWSTGNGIWHITPPSTGAWAHVAMTYDRGATTNNPIMYLDGASKTVTEDSTPSGTVDDDSAGNLLLADFDTTQGFDFDGQLEDVRIADVIWTAEQIARLASGHRGPISNEVLWYSCDHFQGISHPDGSTLSVNTHYLPDQSANDNTGNPTNDPVARGSDAPRAGGYLWATIQTILTQTVAGTITNTGSLVRSTRKIVAGSITNTGSLVREVQKVVAGVITNTSSLVREAQKVVAGVITNTGSLVREVQKVVAGTITNTGALITVKAVLSKLYTWTAHFRASDREAAMHASSDEKRGRA